MQTVYNNLKAVLESAMTHDILQKAQRQGDTMIFFDDFLGDGDVNRKNHTVVGRPTIFIRI
jgi:hypothetical protein